MVCAEKWEDKHESPEQMPGAFVCVCDIGEIGDVPATQRIPAPGGAMDSLPARAVTLEVFERQYEQEVEDENREDQQGADAVSDRVAIRHETG